MFTRVCKSDVIDEGGTRLVIANGQYIILAWPDSGSLKAFQGVCPHTNAPLADAEFNGRLIACPLHNWTWDAVSGAPVHPQESALAEYPLKIEDGVIYVSTEGITPLLAPR
jgi:toluene monooxygenase system ferredoxin subunit